MIRSSLLIILMVAASGCVRRDATPKSEPISAPTYWVYLSFEDPDKAVQAFFEVSKRKDLLAAMKHYGPDGQDYAMGMYMIKIAQAGGGADEQLAPFKKSIDDGKRFLTENPPQDFTAKSAEIEAIGRGLDKKKWYAFMMENQPGSKPVRKLVYPAKALLKDFTIDGERGMGVVEYSFSDGRMDERLVVLQRKDGRWSLARPLEVPADRQTD